jgi:hypothetical protein
MNTVGELLTFALRTSGVNGVGQTPIAEDMNDALILLQMMLAQWQRRRWLVPNEIDLAITSTGAASYSIGELRPDRILAAYVRILGGSMQTDIPLAIIPSREDYSAIVLKGLSTFPAGVFFDTAWPLGRLYFWPIPPAGVYEMHVVYVSPLPVYTALTDAINLPPEYEDALVYSMAVKLAMNYGSEPKPSHVASARAALQTIRVANLQIPPLRMPIAVASAAGSSVAAGSSSAFNAGWMA